MISVLEAKEIIDQNVSSLQPIPLPLLEASGLTLAEDIHATIDIPPFAQSSMDGYAFRYSDLKKNVPLKVVGEVAAGDQRDFEISQGDAVRIFTGAVVPPGADTVVMQEKITLSDDKLIINDDNLRAGDNVRPKGSEINAGTIALEKGIVLSPATIGFLASMGRKDLNVYPNPKISIIITGNELQQPGKTLGYGQVYESNSFALQAALRQFQIQNITIYFASDSLEEVSAVLHKALQQSDIVLLTGGVSVGDYDFVLEACKKCGVEKLFHKVKQRPGKPLFFGKKGTQLVFGLPGNPSSVLCCFYQYVVPAIEIMSQRKVTLPVLQATLVQTFQKKSTLTHFLKGIYSDGEARILEAQESYRLSSFAKANCLIQVEEDVTDLQSGDIVKVHLLPH